MDFEKALQQFERILHAEAERVERIKHEGDFVDYKARDAVVIGICGGDGIGPMITAEARRVLETLLADDIQNGKIELRTIDGLTIENRGAQEKAIPEDVLEALKQCDVILKGPTTTPQKGNPWPNIESANVAMRKALDLFANIRPVRVPEEATVESTFTLNVNEASQSSAVMQVGGAGPAGNTAQAIFEVCDHATVTVRSSEAINLTATSTQPLVTLSLVKLE